VDRLPVGWDEGPGLVASVWRYRWLVAAVALVGVLAGLGVSLVQPVMYEGSSRVLLVDPSSERVFQEGTGQPLDPDRYVRNQAAFMLSPPVLERAVRLVKGRVSVKQLRKRLTTEPSKELDLVTVRVRDRTAGGAAELADAVARAYEETAVQQARASVARTVAQLQATERSLRGRLEELEAKLRAAPSDAAVRVERDAVAAQLAQVDRRSQELGVEGAVGDPVRLREAAEVPESPVQPKPSRLAAVGLLLGLVVAAGLAWWLAWRRQVPATGQPAATWPHAAAPLLGEIPEFAELAEDGQVPAVRDPGSIAGKAYRALAVSLQSVIERTGTRALVVTSPELGDGKTLTSVNLAVAMGESGRHVVLVDADQRRRGLSQLCDLDSQPGLTDLAGGTAPIDYCLWLPAFTSIQVIPAGAPVVDTVGFVEGPTFSRAMFQVRQHANLTVIDGPALLASPDAQAIADQVDGVVLVVRPETSAVALIEARRRLDATGGRLLGYVLNRTGERVHELPEGGGQEPAEVAPELTWRALKMAREARSERPVGQPAEAEKLPEQARATDRMADEPAEGASQASAGGEAATEPERGEEHAQQADRTTGAAAERKAERPARHGAGETAEDTGARSSEANGVAKKEAAAEAQERNGVATEATDAAAEPAEQRAVKASSVLGELPAPHGYSRGRQT
jgi:Mrp family chromosome partitioning ATPase/LPS O-antigen subunit length determinant protein (WzzB/FepE family)